MTDNVAGMLAYVTIIPAIIFLVMEPYNKNRFVRFHSFQCLFFAVALIVLHIGLSILAFVPFMAIITIPLAPAHQSGRVDPLDYSPDEGEPGTDVQTPDHRRYRRETSERDVVSVASRRRQGNELLIETREFVRRMRLNSRSLRLISCRHIGYSIR